MSATASQFEQEYFARHYRDYERQNPPRKLAFYRQLIEPAAVGVARPRVLDLGCAFGRFLEALGPKWERYGLDVSQFAIDEARRALPQATFEVAGATDTPFHTPFDAIVAFDVIEHVPPLDRVAAAVRAMLKPGGYWVFVVPVYDGITGPIIRLLDKDETHCHRCSRWFWLDWAREQGFELVDWQGIYRYLFPGGRYAHWVTRRLRRFTPAIAVVTKRA